jgi:hypothetical protein
VQPSVKILRIFIVIQIEEESGLFYGKQHELAYPNADREMAIIFSEV